MFLYLTSARFWTRSGSPQNESRYQENSIHEHHQLFPQFLSLSNTVATFTFENQSNYSSTALELHIIPLLSFLQAIKRLTEISVEPLPLAAGDCKMILAAVIETKSEDLLADALKLFNATGYFNSELLYVGIRIACK